MRRMDRELTDPSVMHEILRVNGHPYSAKPWAP
jgi:hypothetical protein